MAVKILAVDDEKDIVRLIQHHLKKEGFTVLTAYSGGEALDLLDSQENIALAVLDIMLPGMSGLEICKKIKAEPKTHAIPVIMLTAKAEEEDIVKGLQYGADDYITKPFSPRVLVERVKAVLRRGKDVSPGGFADEVITSGGIEVNVSKFEVKIRGKIIGLTKIEFNVLSFLMKNPGKVFSRDKIMENAWSQDTVIVDRAVDVHIKWLRDKLGKEGERIETVRGVGYRFKE